MARAILSLNAGSSSLKFALSRIDGAGGPVPFLRGRIGGIGVSPHLVVYDDRGALCDEERWSSGASLSHEELLEPLLDRVEQRLGGDELAGVGHRVVHGGAAYSRPVVIDDSVVERLEALCPLAPLHQEHALAAIRAARLLRPHLPQIACFDTAFHSTMSPVARRFALPRGFEEQGIRRYGFHGLSYAWVARQLAATDPELAAGRVIVAHLGNGASLCAMLGGASIDTTMGLTALDGLVMGTRCGSIDPGVILHLQQQHGLAAADVERLLYNQSGLIGVSGVSSDMRALLASADPRAAEAVELFVYRAAREAGALASSLGGLDGLVFTAGIGENSPEIRARICDRLAWLGIELDAHANRAGRPVISTEASRVRVRVVPTNEEQMIADHVVEIVGAGAAPARLSARPKPVGAQATENPIRQGETL